MPLTNAWWTVLFFLKQSFFFKPGEHFFFFSFFTVQTEPLQSRKNSNYTVPTHVNNSNFLHNTSTLKGKKEIYIYVYIYMKWIKRTRYQYGLYTRTEKAFISPICFLYKLSCIHVHIKPHIEQHTQTSIQFTTHFTVQTGWSSLVMVCSQCETGDPSYSLGCNINSNVYFFYHF